MIYIVIHRAVLNCSVILSHSHAAPVLGLLVVIRPVSHSDTLLLDLPPVLPIRLLTGRKAGRDGVVLEDPAHVVEQICDGKKHSGPKAVIEVVQKKLSVLVSLKGRL